MSHWEKIEMEGMDFSSLSALKAAANALGRPLLRNGTVRGWNNQKKKCDYSIPLPGKYDVGFEKQPDGTYSMVADFLSNHISKYLSNVDIETQAAELAEADPSRAAHLLNAGKVGLFLQAYQLEYAKEQALLQGYSYREETINGNRVAILEKPEGNDISTIEMITSPYGEIKAEASGFSGTTCKKATAFLQNLGTVTASELKPEYFEESTVVKHRE